MSIKAMVEHAEQLVADAKALCVAGDEGRWLDVEKEPPPEGVRVLLFRETEGICIGYRSRGTMYEGRLVDVKWMVGNLEGRASSFSLTHWRPLPEPPEGMR